MKRSPGWLNIQQYKRPILLVLPLVLTPSCAFVFKRAVATYGSSFGYLIGFMFYWLFWCMFLPIQLIGGKTIQRYFSSRQHAFNRKVVACLLVPLIFVYVYAFPS